MPRLVWCNTVVLLQISAILVGCCAKVYNGHAEVHNALQLFRVSNLRVGLLHNSHRKTTLAVNATSFDATGTYIEVSWANVPFPSFDDIIALYPADAQYTHTAPIKYKWAATHPTHMITGAGSIVFRLVNMRVQLRAALVRNGLDAPLLVAHTLPITNANPHAPSGVHLALTGREGDMLVQWTASRKSQQPRVAWGTDASALQNVVFGETTSYTREEMCGGYAATIGWMDPGTMQRVLLQNLPADTDVYYSVGDAALNTTSRVLRMRTPPVVGPDAHVRFFAIADMGQAEADGSNEMSDMPDSLTTVARMLDDAAGRSLLIHNGDISYALGFVSEWDAFFDQVEPLTSAMAYMTVMGNHEADWPGTGDRFNGSATPVLDSGGECGVPYLRRLAMPRASEAAPWYLFEYGPVAFVQYSTEHPFEPGTPQYRFIADALASVNRTHTPWLIVGGHRPVYIDSLYEKPPDGDQDIARALRASLEPLFLKHRVDMTWHGHHHSYQRTCPVANMTCVEQGPVHLVIGHAGAGLCYNVQPQAPSVFERVEVAHGFAKVEADGNTLRVTVIGNSDGRVMDEVVLTKGGAAVA